MRANWWGEVGRLHMDRARGKAMVRNENGACGGEMVHHTQLYFCQFTGFPKEDVRVLVPRAILGFRRLVSRSTGVVCGHLFAIVTRGLLHLIRADADGT